MAQSKFIELLEGLENGYHFNHYLGEENKINIFSFTLNIYAKEYLFLNLVREFEGVHTDSFELANFSKSCH